VPRQRLARCLVLRPQQHREHVATVAVSSAQRVDGVVDGGAHSVARGGEAPVGGQRQAFRPVRQHDPGADAVHHYGQVAAQLVEGVFVDAAREDGRGQHVQTEFDHDLTHIEELAGPPGGSSGGDLLAHQVHIAGDLGVPEGGLQLTAPLDVVGASGGHHAVAEQLAHLLEEAALVEGGGEVDKHAADQSRVIDDDGRLLGLETDLDEGAVVAQGGNEAEVVAHERYRVAEQQKRSRGLGYGGRRCGSHGGQSVPSRCWRRRDQFPCRCPP
jgi:hypothetical protein